MAGGEQTSYGVGLNWYPNLNMKFMLDYEHVVVDNPQVFGGPNYRGATIDWIAARISVGVLTKPARPGHSGPRLKIIHIVPGATCLRPV